MKFKIENIGKVEKAEIEIDAITVIGGDNDTGKSTVGRSLYTLFDNFYKVKDRIRNDRHTAIVNVIEQFCIDSHAVMWAGRKVIDEIAFDILENQTDCIIDEHNIENILNHGLVRLKDDVPSFLFAKETATSSDIGIGIRKIHDILALPDESVIKQLVNRGFISEFSGQVSNIFISEASSICLTVKNMDISVKIVDNQVVDIENENRFVFNIAPVYIDDPLVIDRLSATGYGECEGDRSNHLGISNFDSRNTALLRKLKKRKKDDSVSGEILLSDKFNSVFSQVSNLSHSTLVENNNRGTSFKMDDVDSSFELKNLSTGLKSFIILKQLIENGSIENRGLVIIDEPEVHLHPEWQLLYAELIVLLQKEFNLHFLINTHSPYFLRSLEVFAARHGIGDRCRYYLSLLNGKSAVLEDCSANVNRIYSKLAEPLMKLDRIKEEISNGL